MIPTEHLRRIVLGLWAGLLMACPTPGRSEGWEERLAAVDALRNRDTALFIAQARQLRAEGAAVPAAHRAHVDLLAALAAFYAGEPEQALALAEDLARRSTELTLQSRALRLQVDIHRQLGDHVRGLQALETLIALAEGPLPLPLRQRAWQTAAGYYLALEQPQLALAFVERLRTSSPTVEIACPMHLHLLQARIAMGGTGISEADFETGHRACRKTNDTVATVGLHVTLADWLQQQARHADARRVLEEALPVIAASRYRPGISAAMAALARICLEQGDSPCAERMATRVLDLGREHRSSEDTGVARHVLYRVARQRGDAEFALRNLEAYVEANRATLDAVSARHLAVLLAGTASRARADELARTEAAAQGLRTQATLALVVATALAGVIAALGVALRRARRQGR